MPTASSHSSRTSGQFVLIIGIVLIAINLRPALAGVGPLIEDIRAATGLSNAMLGLLTTLPLIAFAVISVFASLLTRRFGIGATMLGALMLLTVGIGVRSIPSVWTLYFGTLLLGVAIAFGNVLLPGLTKRNFAAHSGLMTGLYSSFMGVGAALAAGLSVPLARQMDLGWRGSLATWSILSFVALIIWMPQLGRLRKEPNKRRFIDGLKSMGQSVLAWKVALFMGFQSLTFYVILAWLPAMLLSRGYAAEFSGWMLSLSQITGVIGSMILPYFAGRVKDQRAMVVVLISLEIVALLGLLLPQLGWVALWVGLIGLVLGGSFGLALLFIVLRSDDTETATELSGMVQSIGYLIAAVGPVLLGSLYDWSGDWFYPVIVLILTACIKLYTGLGAGRPGTV